MDVRRFVKKIQKSPVLLFTLVIGIFVVYAVAIIIFIWPIDSITVSQSGVFGDSFGSLTALFSGLAFAGLIVTIWQQQEELSITRNEIRVQHFENMLFRMLEIHNTILAQMDIRYLSGGGGHKQGDILSTGRECFNTFYENLCIAYQEATKANANSEERDNLYDAYEKVWAHHNRDLGHYFRYLYNIFKFIKNSEIENRLMYTNIVRAQLSDYELALLFYNCLSPKGSEKFRPLIEEFHLLNNLPDDLLLDKWHRDLYSASAYSCGT